MNFWGIARLFSRVALYYFLKPFLPPFFTFSALIQVLMPLARLKRLIVGSGAVAKSIGCGVRWNQCLARDNRKLLNFCLPQFPAKELYVPIFHAVRCGHVTYCGQWDVKKHCVWFPGWVFGGSLLKGVVLVCRFYFLLPGIGYTVWCSSSVLVSPVTIWGSWMPGHHGSVIPVQASQFPVFVYMREMIDPYVIKPL